MPHFVLRLRWSRLAVVSSLCFAAAALADEDGVFPSGQAVAAGATFGAFTQSIPIASPPYHGLEPQLALVYSSQGGEGLGGVGWALAGFSSIDRVGADRGTPSFDTSDVFSLDGQDVIPCGTSFVTQPSCLSGGNHATRVEAYLKIFYDSASDTWTVWQRDGRKAVYTATVKIAQSHYPTLRWGLSTVSDPFGNTVSYVWSPAVYGVGPAYVIDEPLPRAVTYNGTVIRIYPEWRPDVVTRANGAGSYRQQYRVKTIDVCVHLPGNTTPCSTSGVVDPDRARLLTFNYRASGATGRSLLYGVTHYGSDARLSASFATPEAVIAQQVTGSRLPTPDYDYPAAPLRRFDWPSRQVTSLPASSLLTALSMAAASAGDVDGDGRTDLVYARAGQSGLVVDLLKAGTSGYTVASETLFTTAQPQALWGSQVELFFIDDFTGDGRGDLLRAWRDNCGTQPGRIAATLNCSGNQGKWRFELFVSNGTGFAAPVRTMLWTAAFYNAHFHIGDVNGDGRAEVVVQGNGQLIPMSWSGSGFVAGTTTTYPSTDLLTFVPGDANGDGRLDMIGVYRTGDNTSLRTFLAKSGVFTAPIASTNVLTASSITVLATLPLDVDGDHQTDVVQLFSQFGNFFGQVMLSAGGRYREAVGGGVSGGPQNVVRWLTGDFDGDGHGDVLAVTDPGTPPTASCSYVPGEWCPGGLVVVPLLARNGLLQLGPGQQTYTGRDGLGYFAADSNGDGKIDFVQPYSTLSGTLAINGLTSMGPLPDVVTRVRSGLGGTTTIGYAQARLENAAGLVPVVTRVDTTDGHSRLADQTLRTETTRYQYVGARFDWATRRLLTFREVTTTGPCGPGSSCPVNLSRYLQDNRAAPLLTEQYRKDSAGRVLEATVVDYATSGNVQSSRITWRTVATRRTTFGYDGTGASCNWPPSGTRVCANGKRFITEYAYDNYGNVVTATDWGDADVSGDEATVTTDYKRDPTGTYIVATPSAVRRFDSAGVLVDETTLTFDALGFNDSVSHRLDATRSLTTVFGRDGYGNAVLVLSPTGRWSLTYYDATYHLFPAQTFNVLGQATTATWDARWGRASRRTDVMAQTAESYVFDPFGRASSHFSAAAGTQTLTYCQPPAGTCQSAPTVTCSLDGQCPSGLCTVTASANACGDPESQRTIASVASAQPGKTVDAVTRFDGFGRSWRSARTGPVSGGAQIESTRLLGDRGRVEAFTAPAYAGDPTATTTVLYDGFGRGAGVRYADLAESRVGYGLSTLTTLDPMGHARRDTADSRGLLIKHEELRDGGAPVVSQLTYDANGRPSTIVDPAQNRWSSTYDGAGRLVATSDPDWGPSSYGHDDDGRRICSRNALGQVVRLAYDALGRLTSKMLDPTAWAACDNATPSCPGNVCPPEVAHWTYDELRSAPAGTPGVCGGVFCNTGRLTTVTFKEGTTVNRTTFDYDARGRVVRKTRTLDGVSYGFEYGFDDSGYLRTVKYPDGELLSGLTYDDAGRLKSVPGWVTDVQYDASDRPTLLSHANGTFTRRVYHPARGWLTGIATCRGSLPVVALDGTVGCASAAATVQRVNASYDRDGKITGQLGASGGDSWTYGYDALERLSSATNLADPTATQTFVWNDIGNLTSRTTGGSTTIYTYPLSGLGSVRPHAVSSAGPATFSYDAAGRMLNGAGRSYTWDALGRATDVSGAAMRYDADGARYKKTVGGVTTTYVTPDYEVTGGVVTKYFTAAGLAVAKRQGATPAWLHTDLRGSVVATTDVNGALVTQVTYRPFGERLTQSGASEPRGYIGERLDESGLQYLNARYYDPALGVFVSPDPELGAASIAGLNRYAYSRGDPINHVDPSGRSPLGPDYLGYIELSYSSGSGWSWGVGGQSVQQVLEGPNMNDAFTQHMLAGSTDYWATEQAIIVMGVESIPRDEVEKAKAMALLALDKELARVRAAHFATGGKATAVPSGASQSAPPGDEASPGPGEYGEEVVVVDETDVAPVVFRLLNAPGAAGGRSFDGMIGAASAAAQGRPIETLTLVAHGLLTAWKDTGKVVAVAPYVGGVEREDSVAASDFVALKEIMAPGGTLVLASCYMGINEAFLKAAAAASNTTIVAPTGLLNDWGGSDGAGTGWVSCTAASCAPALPPPGLH